MTDGAKGNGMTEAKIILAAAAAAAVLSVAAAGGAYLALSGSDERIARCDGGDDETKGRTRVKMLILSQSEASIQVT